MKAALRTILVMVFLALCFLGGLFWQGWLNFKAEQAQEGGLGVRIPPPDLRCMWTQDNQCTTDI